MADEIQPSVFDNLGAAPEPEAAQQTTEESSVFDVIQTAPSAGIRMAVEASEGVQIPQAQKLLRLSNQLGISPYIVRDASEQSEKLARIGEYDLDALQLEAPKLTDWLANDPIKLKALWEDISVYKEIENDIKDFGFFGSLGQIWEGAKYGAYKMLESAAQLPVMMSAPGVGSTSSATIGLSQEQLEDVGIKPVPKEDLLRAMELNPLARPFAEKAKELEKGIPDLQNAMPKFDAAVEQGDYARAARVLLVNASVNLPQLAGIVAASIATRGQSLVLGGIAATTAGGTFEESLKAEDVSPEQAYGNALAATVFEFLGEKFSFGIGQKIAQRTANRFGKETFGRLMTHMGIDIMTGVGAEIMEENATAAGQLAANKIFGVDKTPWSVEQFKDTAKWTSLVSGVSGGLMGGSVSLGTRGRMYIEAQKDMKFYEGLLKRIESAKSKDTVPGSTEQVVEVTTKGSPVEHVWVDAAAFKTLFQKGDSKTPEQEMSEMGIPAKDFEQAVEAGGNVKVPLSKWAGKYAGTPVALGMRADISFDPARGTYNQEVKLQDSMTKLVQSAPGIVDDPRLQEEGVLADPKKLTEILQTKKRADELVKFYEDLKATDPTQTDAANAAIDQILIQKEQLPDPEGDHKKLREGISNLISKEATGLGQSNREGNIDLWEEWILRRAVTMGKKPLDIFQELNVSIQQARSQADLDPVTGESVLFQKNLPAVQVQPTVSPLGFKSAVEEAVLKMDFKSIPAAQLKNQIANLQGVKKEEIDEMGLDEWLDGIESGDIVHTEGQGEEKKLTKKVTKEEVLSFIRQNGVRLEQKVLSDDYDDGEDSDKPHISEIEWPEVEYEDTSHGYYDIEIGDQDFENHSEAFLDELKENDDSSYEEMKALVEAHSKAKGWEQRRPIWDKIENKWEKSSAFQTAIENRIESEQEKIKSGDSIYSMGVSELEIGYDNFRLTQHYDSEWVLALPSGAGINLKTGEFNEAKIRANRHLLDKGYVRGEKTDAIQPNHIVFLNPKGETPSEKTVQQKANALLKKDRDRLIEKAKAEDDYSYLDTEAEKQDAAERDAKYIAKKEVIASYADATNKKNKVTIEVKHPYLKGKIIGNSVTGWRMDVESKYLGMRIVEDLGAIPLEQANQKALDVMRENGVFGKSLEQQKAEDPTFDVNAPTGRAKFKQYTLPGGTNYREFLLTIPNLKGGSFRGHFEVPNVMVHIRVTDRVDAEGKKVLFIEEIQSDLHQQGREQGYNGEVESLRLALNREGRALLIKAVGEQYAEDRSLFVRDIVGRPEEQDGAATAKVKAGLSAEEFNRLSEIGEKLRGLEGKADKQVPNAPFKATDAWAALAMKRMLKVAVEQGYDSIAIAPAEVHIDRWGTDVVSWKKVDGVLFTPNKKYAKDYEPTFYIDRAAAVEDLMRNGINNVSAQLSPFSGWVASDRDNFDIDNPDEIEIINNKEYLKDLVARIKHATRLPHEEVSQRAVESITDKIWKMMEEGKDGVKKPRKEGFEFFYDKLLPTMVLPKILKKLDKDAKVEAKSAFETPTKVDDGEGGERDSTPDDNPAWVVKITDKMKAEIQKGMTLFQKPGDQPFGQTAFGNDQVIITLFAGKNPSTLPHESMHFFVAEMAKDIAELQLKSPDDLTPDQVRYMQDAGAMLEFAGATSFETLTEEGQEKIARAFEKYLMQGKAPSKKLRRSFKRFAIWLTSLYGRAKNELNVDLTPEMIRVFDNMLSVESASLAARGAHDTLFDDPKLYGFSTQEATRYRRAVDDSVLAQEEIVRQILLKEQERELKRERRALKKRVALEVEQRREYQLIGRLKEAGIKIDGNLIIDMIGEDAYAKLPKGVAAKTSDGQLIDPEAAAEAMDYGSASQMLEELLAAPPIDEAIEQETERQFNELFGDMIAQGRIEQEAIDAYNNQSMADKIRMEMEMLMTENFRAFAGMAKKINKRLPSQEEIKANAKAVVSRLKVSELKEAQFKRAMDHARAEAMSLFLEAKYEEAWEAKRKELLNHEILREVVKAKKDVDASLKRFRVLRKSDEDLSKSRNVDLVNAARMVLMHFGLWDQEAAHGKNPDSYLKKLEEIDPDQLMGLNAIIDNAMLGVPEQDYTELSYQQFERMSDAVLAIWSVAKSSMEMEIEGKKLNRKEVVAELNKDIEHAQKMRVKPLKKFFDKYGPDTETEILGSAAWLTKIEHWAEAMGPSFKKYITRPVFHAIDEYRARKAKEMKRLMEILKPLKGNLHRKVIEAPELGGTKKSFRGKNELMGALLHIGNKSNLMKLLVGYGWGAINEDTGEVDTSRWDAFLKRMFDTGEITQEDMNVIQAIWDLNESLKPEAQIAHRDQYGFFFDEITASPVVTPFGTYRGGYMPATRDPVLAQKVDTYRQAENLLVEQHVGTFPTTGRGFTMSRVGGAEPLLLSLNATAAHLDQVLRFVYINPAVRAAGRLFNDKDFMANMNALDPTVVRELLIPWAKRAAHQRKSESAKTSWQRRRFAWARHLRQFAGLNALAFNVTNAFQNVTGKSLAATKVHPKFLAKANALYWRNPKAASEEIQRRSKFMDQRITTQLFDITKGVNDLIVDPSAIESGREWVNKNGYWLARVTQDYFDRIAWMGAYHEMISKNASEKEAVAHADETVRMTQGSFEAESMSEAEFGSPVVQIFNMFFGYFNNQANLNVYQHQKNMRELAPMKQKFARAAYLYAVAFMVPALLNGGIRVLMSGDDWDEDDDGDIYDDVLSLFFNEQINQALAMVPHVGGLIKYLRDLGDDKRFNDRLTASPVFSFLESAGRGVYAVPNLVEDLWDGNTLKKQEIRDALALLGFLTKTPTVPFSKPINYQMDLESGKAEPTGPIDRLRGYVTGKPGGQ